MDLNGLHLFHFINILIKYTCRHLTDSVRERQNEKQCEESITMQDETGGEEKSLLAYHQEQKVLRSYSPRRASLPLQSQNHKNRIKQGRWWAQLREEDTFFLSFVTRLISQLWANKTAEQKQHSWPYAPPLKWQVLKLMVKYWFPHFPSCAKLCKWD